MYVFIVHTGLLVTAAAALCACGCRSLGDRYQVHLDPAFTLDEMTIVMGALDEWGSRVPVHFETTVSYCSGDHDGQICMHPEDPAAPYCTGSLSAHIEGGCTDDTVDVFGRIDGHDVYLLPMLQVDALRQGTFWNMTRHELGHAMWLAHSKPGSIMCATMDCEGSPGHVSDNDVDQWWEVRR